MFFYIFLESNIVCLLLFNFENKIYFPEEKNYENLLSHPRQKFAKRMWFLGFFHGNKKCWASENTVVLDHPVNICRTFKHFSCIVESHVSYSRLLHCLPVLKLAGQSKLVPVYLPSCLFQGFQLFDFPYIAFPMLTIVQAWFFLLISDHP